MSRDGIKALFPGAVTNSQGDLFLETEVAGENSVVLFVFVDDALSGTLVHRNYGSDREPAIGRFRLLYRLLKNRFGNPTEKGGRCMRKAAKTGDGSHDKLILYACWKDEGTDILLVCARTGDHAVHTSIIYQRLPYPCIPLIQDYSIYLSLLEDRPTGSGTERQSDPAPGRCERLVTPRGTFDVAVKERKENEAAESPINGAAQEMLRGADCQGAQDAQLPRGRDHQAPLRPGRRLQLYAGGGRADLQGDPRTHPPDRSQGGA